MENEKMNKQEFHELSKKRVEMLKELFSFEELKAMENAIWARFDKINRMSHNGHDYPENIKEEKEKLGNVSMAVYKALQEKR